MTIIRDDKLLMLKTHPCSTDLDEDVCREISEKCELVQYKAGDVLYEAAEVMSFVNLIIIGRLELIAYDHHGQIKMRHYLTTGRQYGATSAALGEPTSVKCVAIDPTTILRLDFQHALDLTKRHDQFRLNMTRLVADGIQRVWMNEKVPVRPHFVGIFHQGEETRFLTRKIMERLTGLGEEVCMLSDRESWDAIPGVEFRHVYLEHGRETDDDEIRRQLAKWSQYPRIVVDVDTSIDKRRADRIVNASDLVLWCVTPENWRDSVIHLEELERQASGWRDKVCIVWHMGDECYAPVAAELNRLAKSDIKISFNEPAEHESRALRNGFERLVHMLRGIQIGVALGGGAARGMAHLGVLKALEENGIVVDMIAGTSAGAMTGTLYASGMGAGYAVDCFVKDLRPSWFFRSIPRGDQWYLVHKYRRGKFDPMLRKYLHDHQLEQLPLPMNSITVDLVSGKVIVRDAGDATQGIIESINLPVISIPIMRQGQALVDGGIINNIPADVLAAKGCNFVIAVSVTAKMEMEFAKNRPETPKEKMKAPSTLQTILRTYFVQNASVNSYGVQPADIVIEPDVTQFELTDFVKTDQLAAIGESTATESLPEIRRALARLDSQLFPNEG